MKTLDRKLSQLRKLVRSFGSAAVAFSGGADSTLVARITKDELGDKTVAVTIDSPMYPASELAKAKAVAKTIGVEHVVVRVDPLGDSAFITNPPDRCYLCKRDDLTHIRRIADDRGLREVLDGSNADDSEDYRPGLRAKEEMKVRSPLAECGLTKADVRAISKALKLPTAHKSSSPCLASRIPYGERITTEKLRMIEEAEEFLKAKGFDDVRVRMHGNMARIEVSPKDVSRLTSPGTRISVTRKLRALGFTYVAVDLEGYRMGSLNRGVAKMNPEKIEKILSKLSKGDCSVGEALEQLRTLPYDDLKFAKLDHHRELRKGIPEAIYSPGKTDEQILGIAARTIARKDEAVFTRMNEKVYQRLRSRFGSKAKWYPEARIVTIGVTKRKAKGKVLIVTAGTSDIPVAEEAAVTCELLGCRVERLYDVGVAGMHRLTSNLKQFDSADVIIVLAGMEGALPTVVAGLTSKPVVAVPTSVGYGASFGGIAALLGMLSSCSSGIGVVNIDNGFGAGALATVIIKNKYGLS